MISALDTSVLLDVFLPDKEFVQRSRAAIVRAYTEGALVICEPVYAELASRFDTQARLDEVLDRSKIRVEPVSRVAAFQAGRLFRRYRESAGKRERMITDFLIGSHATLHASALITRDRGFYRKYFEALRIAEP